MLSAAPNANHHEDSGVVQGTPCLAVKVAALSDRLASQVAEPFPHRVLVACLDPPLDQHLNCHSCLLTVRISAYAPF